MSCFTTGGPGKGHGTNKPPPTGRAWERSKCDTACPAASQNPSRCIRLGWVMHAPPEGLWVRTTGQRPPGNESHHHETRACEPLESSSPGFPHPPALHLGTPSQQNLLLSQHMCLPGQFISECWTRAHFWSLDVVPLPATLPSYLPENLAAWPHLPVKTELMAIPAWLKPPNFWFLLWFIGGQPTMESETQTNPSIFPGLSVFFFLLSCHFSLYTFSSHHLAFIGRVR